MFALPYELLFRCLFYLINSKNMSCCNCNVCCNANHSKTLNDVHAMPVKNVSKHILPFMLRFHFCFCGAPGTFLRFVLADVGIANIYVR